MQFKTINSKAFFHKLTERFVNRKLSNIWELVIHIIHETTMMTSCNSKQVSLGATRIRNKTLKQMVNHRMIKPTSKPRNMYDSKKRQ